MISMTGYAKKEFKINNLKFSLIIRSLNSNKGLDFNIKTPHYLLNLEPEIKKMIDQTLVRGKIDLKILETSNLNKKTYLDKHKLLNYINLLKEISPKSDSGQILNAAITLPDIFSSQLFQITLKTQKEFLKNIKLGISDLHNYRAKEGQRLKQAIKKYINNILKISKKLIPLEKNRTSKKKKKLFEQINRLSDTVEYKKTRLESEMIYYFERNDITEEMVRLKYHCNFFLEIITQDKIVGRKLIFISQEILREINTIGSKANDFEIQKCVVQMKENIDKTKEQLQNVL